VEIVGRALVKVDADVAAGMREQLAAAARRDFLVVGTDEDAKRRVAPITDGREMTLESARRIERERRAKAGVRGMFDKPGRIGRHARQCRAAAVRPALEANP